MTALFNRFCSWVASTIDRFFGTSTSASAPCMVAIPVRSQRY